jgi:hypothetical protein
MAELLACFAEVSILCCFCCFARPEPVPVSAQNPLHQPGDGRDTGVRSSQQELRESRTPRREDRGSHGSVSCGEPTPP